MEGRPGSTSCERNLCCLYFISGTFQQVTNLLNIMDNESAKSDKAGEGLDMRKTLASVIITDKATSEPSTVMNALICSLRMSEVGSPPPGQHPPQSFGCLHICPLPSTHLEPSHADGGMQRWATWGGASPLGLRHSH